jgi:cytosine/adenosine deaminase-related metal-dependent hydrolase
MAYRKYQADQIFTGIDLLSGDQVLITNQQGVIEAIIPANEAGEDILYKPGCLSPGFVNAHCHLELSHMKGLIPEGTGMVDFILSILQLRHFPEEEILQAISDAESKYDSKRYCSRWRY